MDSGRRAGRRRAGAGAGARRRARPRSTCWAGAACSRATTAGGAIDRVASGTAAERRDHRARGGERSPARSCFAVVDGALMASEDGGRQLAAPRRRAWATRRSIRSRSTRRRRGGSVGRGRRLAFYVSDDLGATWRAVGRPLPEPGTRVRGIAADPAATTLVVTTHRGMYRSEDGGQSWTLKEGNLPVHLEAGPAGARPERRAHPLCGVFADALCGGVAHRARGRQPAGAGRPGQPRRRRSPSCCC